MLFWVQGNWKKNNTKITYNLCLSYLDAEVNDGHIRGVEFVQDLAHPEVESVELDVVDHRVRDAAARELDILEHPLPLRALPMTPVHRDVDHTSNLELWSGPVSDGGFA